MADKITAQNLLKTEGIITCDYRDSLSQALAKLTSSHDAVFVTGKKNELLGVISPYYLLQKTNYQNNAKVENYLFSPPKIREFAPLDEIAKNMLESKVYYLPVFSQNNHWLGIVTVRSLLRAASLDKELSKNLKTPPRRKILTISEKATLKDARAIQSNGKVSRLPVVNRNGKLVGILTRYELQEAFSVAKSSPRFLSRQGEKRKFIDKPISNYLIRSVVTAGDQTPLTEMIKTMLDKRVGSIVIVNRKWQPVNILTTSDLLKNLSQKGKPIKTNLVTVLPDDFPYRPELNQRLEKITDKLKRYGQLRKIKFSLSVSGPQESKRHLYQASLVADYQNRPTHTSVNSDFDWKKAFKNCQREIRKQAAKSSN